MNEKFLNDATDIGIGTAIGKLQDAGLGTAEAIEVLKLMEFRTISDALEGINNNLSDIAVSLDSVEKNLDGCVSVNGDNHFLCITGNVSTY